jgi:lipoate-protein ligase A
MRESRWRLIHDGPADGPWNMAVDEAIARAAGEDRVPPTLRFYTWSVPTVSLGCLQGTPGGVDLAGCHHRGIALVRRVTGGRAVLHADELTYSVVLPLRGAWRHLSVPQTFSLISHGLIAGLKHLGVDAAVGEPGRGPGDDAGTGACFLLRRMPAVLADGRKLIGSAQRRWERSVLQHGSLLLDFEPDLHRAVFPAWPRSEASVGVTCLRAILGERPPLSSVVAALVSGWREVFGVACVPGDLTGAEQDAARDLARTRYGSAAWTFHR